MSGPLSTIREYGAMAGQKYSFLQDSTRYDYMDHFLARWLSARRFRGYAFMAGIAGAYFLLSAPIISMALFAAAAYFFTQHQMNAWYTEGEYAGHRNLIMAD